MSWFTQIAGAFIEAWDELRVHRVRVTLALVGIGIAVFAIVAVTGLGSITRQSSIEISERSSGRPASYQLMVSSAATDDKVAIYEAAYKAAIERYGITYQSTSGSAMTRIQFVDGVADVESTIVDPAYGEMHRVKLIEGSWLTSDDADRLAPAVVINETMWNRLGNPSVAEHPTLQVAGAAPTTAVVVGVSANIYPDYPEQMYVLSDAQHLLGASSGGGMMGGMVMGGAYAPPSMGGDEGSTATFPTYELWLPLENHEELSSQIVRDLKAALGEGGAVDAQRTDYLAWGEDPFLAVQILVTAVGGIVLLVGTIGFVNLSIVTVKQRVREIGIRRSFGATGGRVFFSILLESVVGTLLAGIVGIGCAIVTLQNPLVQGAITGGLGLTDSVPFPVDAAVLGIVVSVGVGLLAGFIPAVIATRSNVIDAIRS
ncbi:MULTISPECIES: ABC transporter permease [unclassified Pseudoclavibacter]|uniref:ABC transporter permease n=1 Tax=unclassified Pseudoclavibacter TaxID=2615177 RepID=UPI000CE7A835|nr:MULTISPECIES: ABC transporter permease [unclassified Pseudoclavibacter]MBF4551449.1 ABC transporter permease [Pseudoclavibacter sp. VKM Ac-2888]PPF72568.1 ABC transporter permease [Pseudoclavibacter sp. Z016]